MALLGGVVGCAYWAPSYANFHAQTRNPAWAEVKLVTWQGLGQLPAEAPFEASAHVYAQDKTVNHLRYEAVAIPGTSDWVGLRVGSPAEEVRIFNAQDQMVETVRLQPPLTESARLLAMPTPQTLLLETTSRNRAIYHYLLPAGIRKGALTKGWIGRPHVLWLGASQGLFGFCAGYENSAPFGELTDGCSIVHFDEGLPSARDLVQLGGKGTLLTGLAPGPEPDTFYARLGSGGKRKQFWKIRLYR